MQYTFITCFQIPVQKDMKLAEITNAYVLISVNPRCHISLLTDAIYLPDVLQLILKGSDNFTVVCHH